jgi:hypothetical protein
MHAFPKVGIIVLNYNGMSCLSACLQSLEQLEYPSKDIIVIDNASADGSLAMAEKEFPHLTFVRNRKNEGFAKGMNIGMRLAILRGAQWAWIFNYDAVADPEALAALILAAEEHPRAGLLSPVISETESGTLWFAKGEIDRLRMRTRHTPPTKKELASKAYPSEFLTGCALLIKKELIDAIGVLDERFFLYYEDADYSVRATRAGFACLVVPQAKVTHSEAINARPGKTYFLVYSGLLFFTKWASPLMHLYLPLYVTMRRVKNFFDRLCGRRAAAREAYRAYRDYYEC